MPLFDHMGQVIDMGDDPLPETPPNPPLEWLPFQRVQALALLGALVLEAFVPGGFAPAVVGAAALGYALFKLPENWSRPGPFGSHGRVVVAQALGVLLLPLAVRLGGLRAGLVLMGIGLLLAGLRAVLSNRKARPHHLEFAGCLAREVDALSVAIASSVLHASGAVGVWVLWAGALRYMYVLALIGSGSTLEDPPGVPGFFQPLVLLALTLGFSQMPLAYVPAAAVATMASAVVFGRATLRELA